MQVVLSNGVITSTLQLHASGSGPDAVVVAPHATPELGPSLDETFLLTPLHIGDAPITADESAGANVVCPRDGLLNTVRCASTGFAGLVLDLTGSASGVELNLLPTSDRGSTCVIGFRETPVFPVTGLLSTREDTLRVAPLDDGCPVGSFAPGVLVLSPRLNLDAGDGDDSVAGGDQADTIFGGAGRDTLAGGGGDDRLEGGGGPDTLSGQGGDDSLKGGANTDRLDGGPGDDTLDGGTNADTILGRDGIDTIVSPTLDGPDRISGGAGFDTLDYSGRTQPLFVTMGGGADDGEAGEGDDVQDDINRVIGGRSGDQLTGSSGADTIEGGPGADVINGGLGPDTLSGGPGADTIEAVDGVADTVSCGADTDTALIDLKDTVAGTLVVRPPFGTFQVTDCETVTRAAADDSPPGRPLALRITGGVASVRFRCPRTSRPRCRGRLVLRDPTRRRRVIGQAAYDLALGTDARIDVRLASGAPARIRRGAPVLATTVERGHSRLGPRHAERLFQPRR